MKNLIVIISLLTLSLVTNVTAEAGERSRLSGTVKIDGSSTVYPITEAVAEEFGKIYPRIRVTVGISGTGGGFKKFLAGETDISDASRPIKSKELAKAREKGINFIEMPVAYDGVSIVVNPKNDFVDYLTLDELKKIWQPGSTVKNWSDVRPGWPNKPLMLFGPGTDSGTFDYFTKAVNGKSGSSRPDYTASANPNVLVQGIAGDGNALGYFGYAYYAENRNKLKLVPIDAGNGPVAPSATTINNGTYKPFSRPIFIYVREKSLTKRHVSEFVDFYLKNAGSLSKEVGYVPLSEKSYAMNFKRVANRVTGSVF